MNLDQRLHSFLVLSEQLKLLDASQREAIYSKAYIHNPWFTKESVDLAFDGLFRFLQKDKLLKWLESYKERLENPKTIGVVMAGNIPMVGIHDFLTVLISGHKLQAKLSAKDEVLIRYVSGLLCEIEPTFTDYIQFVDKLQGYDAIIATGSDNTARYFEYYFSKVPHIIRKNRTSIGILSGDEKPDDYELLTDDIFQYFGLGCRNISKIYLPEKIKPEILIPALRRYAGVIDHNKYANNYYYNRSIFLVNQTPHVDAGFFLMQENMDLVSPLSVLYYEYYKSAKDLELRLGNIMDKIQCSVSKDGWYADSLPFGTAQKPEVWEYADHVDTLDFLLNL